MKAQVGLAGLCRALRREIRSEEREDCHFKSSKVLFLLQVDDFCQKLSKEVSFYFIFLSPYFDSDSVFIDVYCLQQAEQLLSKFFPEKIEQLQMLLKVQGPKAVS